MRILIAEDDPKLRKTLVHIFEPNHYAVDSVDNGMAAITCASAEEDDGLVLDIMMPGLDGVELLRKLRSSGITTPALFLTARTEIQQRIEGLDAGADDFISKPFGMMELVARVRAVLRRMGEETVEKEYCMGCALIRPEKHQVLVNGAEVQLTYKEFELLCLLLENRGKVLSRSTLLDRVWGSGMDRENRTLDVHIRTLRAKLGEAGSCIETVRGVGYKIGGSV